jgi:hypothetical protein
MNGYADGEPFGHLCLPFGLGVNVRDTAYEPGHCDLSYSTRRSPVTVTICSASMRNFSFTSPKMEIPETRAKRVEEVLEARGLGFALLLELRVLCLL